MFTLVIFNMPDSFFFNEKKRRKKIVYVLKYAKSATDPKGDIGLIVMFCS